MGTAGLVCSRSTPQRLDQALGLGMHGHADADALGHGNDPAAGRSLRRRGSVTTASAHGPAKACDTPRSGWVGDGWQREPMFRGG